MANDTLSINKIVSIFRDLALRQKMVTDFGYGPTYNIGASRQMKFPYIWVEQNSTTTSKSDNGYKEAYLSFTIFCMDKISMGDDNYDEIISDTHYILDTMVQEIAQHKYYVDMNLSIDGDINFDPVVEGTDDNVNGWQADITLKMPIRYTPCNSPIEPISGYTTQLNADIAEYRLMGIMGPTGPTGPAGLNGATGPAGTGTTYVYITEDVPNTTFDIMINEPNGFITSTINGDIASSYTEVRQDGIRLESSDNTISSYSQVNITTSDVNIGSIDLNGNNSYIDIQGSNTTISTDLLTIQSQYGGGYTLPSTDGNSGDILTTNGSGVATWQPNNSSTSGTSGVSGSSGTSGVNGTSGTSGFSGTSGSSGTSGINGLSGDLYKTTSTSSFTLGSSGTITIGTNLAYSVSQDIIISHDISNHQVSMVISYNPSTGVLVFSSPSQVEGSGTYTSWNINLNGAAGGDGTSGTSGVSGTSGTSGSSGTSGVSGYSSSLFLYKAKTTQYTNNPGASYILWDNATQASATNLHINHLTTDNIDIDIFLALIGNGNIITIQHQTNSGDYQTWRVNGTPTLIIGATNYWIIPVSLLSSTISFGNNDDIFIAISANNGTSGSSGTSGTSGLTGTSGTSGVSGTSGTSGVNGLTGTSGTSGINGLTGTSGTSGVNGTSGINGIDASGTSGTSGLSGSSGTSGVSGSSGTSGVNGTSGLTQPEGFHPILSTATGLVYNLSIGAVAKVTIAQAANRLDLMPFIPSATFTSVSLSIDCTTLIASSLARILIYSDLNGKPDTKLLESTNLDCSTTGIKTYTSTFVFTAGTVYWIGTHASSTQTLRGIPLANSMNIQTQSITGTIIYNMYRGTVTFGSAPATYGLSGTVASSIMPEVKITT